MTGLTGRGRAFGLEVGHGVLRAALMNRKGGTFSVTRLESVEFPGGAMLDSFTKPNILDRAAFVDAARKLAGRTGRRGGVNVALPDHVARVVMLDFEKMPKKADDAGSMIKWRLKKLMPFDVEQASLRFQYLGSSGEKAGGGHRYLAAVIKSDILGQYEDALGEAGLRPRRIDISSFCVWNFYHDFLVREASGRSFCILNMCRGKMTVMVFDSGVIRFFRLKDLSLEEGMQGPDGYDAGLVLKELRTSLTYYKEHFQGGQVGLVFVAGHMDDPEKAVSEIAAGTGLDARALKIDMATDLGGVSYRSRDGVFYSAACGAALER